MIPCLTTRAADEPLHTYGARALVHVMHHGTAGIEDAEALELAVHVARNVHTEGSTDAVTAAVVEIRRTLARRRAHVARVLGTLGLTAEPSRTPAGAAYADALSAEEITFLKNLYREVKGQAGEPEGGARVPRTPRGPSYPPAGAAANGGR